MPTTNDERERRARVAIHAALEWRPPPTHYTAQERKEVDALTAAMLAFVDGENASLHAALNRAEQRELTALAELDEAKADAERAREGTLSREDVATWLEDMTGMRMLAGEVRNGAIEAWLAARGKDGGK